MIPAFVLLAIQAGDAAAAAAPSITEVANYGVAGLLAFVLMFVVQKITGKASGLSAEDRALLERIAGSTAATAATVERLSGMADQVLLQHVAK